ncbi:MAG: ABC transporter permease [Anaerolinea sp.]|nr:ABC transporter permease [Anaerolinea sp.]
MTKTSSLWINTGFRIAAIVLALAFTSIVLLLSNARPFEAFANIINGSIGSSKGIANTLVAWVPLLLVTSGLLMTYATGMWNIGIEGQITLGAIFTTLALRLMQGTSVPPTLAIILSILAGILGGALWAGIVALLKIYGGVNEIFGGLGMNFVSTALTIWLIFGPWKRPGTGSMSGTEPFDTSLWLPQLEGLRISLWSVGIGIVGLLVVYFILQGTYFGLKLKAVGKNGRAAFLLGVPTTRYIMAAFLICGAFAGIAGAIQVTGVYHRLIPSISSGYGYLGMMVAMLVNFQALWAGVVALFFAALNIGSIQLPIVMKIDSTLSGVLQGALVLFFLLMEGARRTFLSKKRGK